jgi:hypothetical protein
MVTFTRIGLVLLQIKQDLNLVWRLFLGGEPRMVDNFLNFKDLKTLEQKTINISLLHSRTSTTTNQTPEANAY